MSFLISILLLLASSPAWALKVPMSYFEDKTASLTIENIIALPGTEGWHPVAVAKPQFGPTHSRIWFRFFLPTESENSNEVLLLEIPNSYLKKLDLYAVVDGRVVRHSATGTAVPLSGRDDGVLRAATFTFRILPPWRNPPAEYFLSVESDFPISVPFHLWKAKNYTANQWVKYLVLGVFFGGLAIAAGFNGFLAFSLRSRLYLYYSLFVTSASMLFLAHEGLSVQFFWPESPWWAVREPFFFGGIAVIFYALFVREFLESRRIAPRLDLLLRSLAWAVFISDGIAVITVRQPFTSLSQVFVVILNLLALAIAAKALRLRTRAAGYFLLSSLAFNVSMIFFQLQESNLIWIGSFLEKAPHVSLALEVLLLSFALADRIRQVNLELSHQKAAMMHSEKMSALGRLAGEISHEINNPLSIIHGNAALIGKTDSSPQVKEFAATIELTANRISKIVKGMRSLARDSRNDSLQRASLLALIQDAVSLCGERAQQENVRLDIVKPEADISVLCRSSEICQVLLNLMNNAFDAVEGLPSGWIKMEAEALPFQVEISVTDSGPGVPKDVRPRILDPFFSTKEPGKGLGLGLSISRSIVEAHGGKIWLDEKSPHTRFVFSLPLAREKD